jgi:hypothetical protein
LLLLLALAANAQDVPDEGDDVDISNTQKTKESDSDWAFEKDKTKLTLSVDDDEGMADFAAQIAEQKKRAAPPPVWFHLDLMGKRPLADNFDVQFDAFDPKYVVVELPVLVSISRPQFAAEHPNGVTLIAEITSGGAKLVQTEHITPASVLDAAPTLVFFKAAMPNTAKSGDVRFLVKIADLPAPPAPGSKAAPPPPAPPKDLFARTTVFVRPQ